ncbi:MAG: SUMF1/EgtB/PvdO family nonheme iron enzyme [Verrucomicrobiota bacterium]
MSERLVLLDKSSPEFCFKAGVINGVRGLGALAVLVSFYGTQSVYAEAETWSGLTSLRPGWSVYANGSGQGGGTPSKGGTGKTGEPPAVTGELSAAIIAMLKSQADSNAKMPPVGADLDLRIQEAQRALDLAKRRLKENGLGSRAEAERGVSMAEEILRALSRQAGAEPPEARSIARSENAPEGEGAAAGADVAAVKRSKGNSIGMVFVPVGDVLFSIYETRVKDFAVFVEESDYPKTRWKAPGFVQTPEDPVVMVSWNDAMSFCMWLTARERKLGLLGPAEYYRLPTDLEWSQAVGLPLEPGKCPAERDGSFPDRFPWGTQWPPPPGVGNFSGTSNVVNLPVNACAEPFAATSPAGAFRANKYGLFDMSGNVWEWCLDTSSKQRKTRVLRGGSWLQGALREALLSSFRLSAMPESESNSYGFRVIRSTDGGLVAQ